MTKKPKGKNQAWRGGRMMRSAYRLTGKTRFVESKKAKQAKERGDKKRAELDGAVDPDEGRVDW